MWPFVPRTQYDDLHARYQRVLERCRELEEQCVAEQDARRLIAAQYADADAAARRVHARNQRLTEELEKVRSTGRKDAAETRLLARLHRVLRACARYRIQVAARDRMIRAQQRQLDDALGLNIPEILAGANWQERRADKREWVS